MTQPNTTRRDLLRFGTSAAAYAASAAIVTGGVALASQAKGEPAPDVDRRAWDAAYKRCADAKAAYDEDYAVFRPIFDAWRAGKPDGQGVNIRAFHMMPRRHVLDAVDPDQYHEDWLASIGRNYFPNEREKAADLASIDSLRAFRREQEAHDERYRIDELGERSDALCDAWSGAQSDLMQTPALDLLALQWKLEHVLECERDGSTAAYNFHYVAPILADVARLSGQESGR